MNERDQLLFADLSLGVVSAGYEHILAERIGLSGAVGIYGPWYIDRPVDIFAFNAEFRVFWYILGTASKAQLYVSPAFRLGRPRADDDGRTLKGISYAPRVSAGGTFRFGHFFFRLGIGIQHENVDLDRRATGESVDIHRVTPVVDAYVGAAF
ncbi:MAG: hypothetical protein AAGE52_16870 [Myxococcota bacterium]